MANQIRSDEFRQRLKKVREAMLRQQLDALVVFSQKRGHITYLSGYYPNYHTNAALMLITAERDPTLWIKFAFDLPRAKATSWLEDIRACASDDVGDIAGMIAKVADDIRSLRLESSRIGLVTTDLAVDELSVSFHERICRELPRAQLVPASDLVNELRLIKSQNEIALLRQAAQLAEVAAESLRKSIRPGVKDSQATAIAEHAAKLEGADLCDFFISADPALHALPPSGLEFKAGSPVTFEITIRYAGYWIQMCRVFSLGKPAQEQMRVFEVCRDAYQAEVRAARPGVTVDQVAEAAQGVIAAAGFKDCTPYGLGHGVGLDLPELYSVERECRARLAPGVVLVLHPSIWVPKQGSAYVGGPIAITENGALPLDNPVSEMVGI
jgi:Xaa-Pro aminopeptidase